MAPFECGTLLAAALSTLLDKMESAVSMGNVATVDLASVKDMKRKTHQNTAAVGACDSKGAQHVVRVRALAGI